jgi:hypothetical protein
VLAQTTVTGRVTSSADGLALPGVSVLLKGTTTGIVTDADGDFSIQVPDSRATLQFSFIGFGTHEVVVGNQTVINVSLAETMLQMDEVVVTALGIKRQTKALSYAAAEVKGNDIQKVPELNLMNSLQGKIAGVDINMAGTGAAGSSRVTIRGNTSISRDNNPLYVIDDPYWVPQVSADVTW